MEYSYRPKSVCSSNIKIIIDDGIITDVVITGGCDGNLKGIINLVKGRKPEDIIPLLKGIKCGSKKTSCPDQLSIALEKAIEEVNMEEEKIKIFGEKNSNNNIADTESLIAQTLVQKENGNLDKARKLGSILADECIDNDGEFEFGFDEKENNKVLMQRRLLLAFTIQYGLQRFSPNTLVEKTAVNHFFSYVEEKASYIYENIQENGAFSYYTLCARKEKDSEECIGKTFAELSGYKNDETYEKLGRALFLHFLDLIEEKINQLYFE